MRNFSEEYVLINGINQYFLHYPSPKKEVVIHLHGGPGSSAASFSYTLSAYRDICNIVYYDQRGTGRTQKRNKTKQEDITLENMISDLRQTIIYIKEKYTTDRVILMGQSWGTVLGTQYILKYPKDIIGYIGTGHCIDTRREMKISYDKLKESIESKGNKRDMRKLEAMKNYPYLSVDDKNYVSTEIKFFMLKTKYGLTLQTGKLLKITLRSPVFKLSDIFYMVKGTKTNKHLMIDLTSYSIWDTTDYSVPVYYVLGQDDWQVPSILAAEYFEKINAPQKGLYWIENAGHATDVDNPVDFCKVVKEIIMQL